MDAVYRHQSLFQYDPLDDVSSNIRLLRVLPSEPKNVVSCSLEQATIHQPYTCLSYCWGADRDHEIVFVNGKSVLVRPNLYQFLHRAKKFGFHQLIWVDAISINQADVIEKSKQVQMMGEIYSRAICTLVWLGLSESDCQLVSTLSRFVNNSAEGWELEAWMAAFGGSPGTASDTSQQVIEDIKQGHSSARERLMLTALHDGSSGNPVWGASVQELPGLWAQLLRRWCEQFNKDDFIYRLTSSGYWRRTWIIQELMLSQNPILFSQTDEANVRVLLPFILNILHTMRCDQQEGSVEREKLLDLQEIIYSITLELTGTLPKISTKTHFASAIRLTAGRLCTDIRDRIFAVVSLITNGNRFLIDYKLSLDELLVKVLLFHIADRGDDLIITRVLPRLFEATVDTLEIRPPKLEALPALPVALHGSFKDFSSIKERFFWARAPARTKTEFELSDGQDCSLCIGTEVCGHRGVLEFWCRWDTLKCYKNLFWWEITDRDWKCRVAGDYADDL